MPKENLIYGILYVRVVDMKGDRINLEGLRRTSKAISAKYARASLKVDDVLLAIRGTYGRIAIAPAELEGANITQDTARIAPLPGVTHDWIATYLRSTIAQNYFKPVARGVAVKGVNIGDIRPMLVPLELFWNSSWSFSLGCDLSSNTSIVAATQTYAKALTCRNNACVGTCRQV